MSQPRSTSWLWLLILFTGVSFIEVIFWSQLQAFTPIYLPKLGITDPGEIKAWTGALVAIATGVGLPFLPLWGALADRYARQPVIVRSFVAHLLAGILCVLAGNIWLFLLGRSIQSLSLGNSGLMMTTLSESVPKNKIGLAFSIMNGAGPIGAFLGPLIGGPVVDIYGFPTLLAINIGLMLLAILALAFGYRDTFRGTARGPLIKMALDSVGIIVRSARLRVLFPALFLLFAGWMLAFTYVPLIVQAIYKGADIATVTGYVIGGGGLVALLASPLVGALGDRLGYWRVLFGGAGVAVVLWVVPFFTRELVQFAVAWAAANGVTTGLFALSFTVLSNSTLPSVRGRVMSFSYLPVNLGYSVGPLIGSIVAQASLFAIFPAAAAITAVSIGVLVMASRTRVDALGEESEYDSAIQRNAILE